MQELQSVRPHSRKIRRGFRIVRRELQSREVLARLRLLRQNFKKNPPILVYQMAKVGSRSVYDSLRSSTVSHPVYHVHFLSENSLRCAEERYMAAGRRLPGYLVLNRALRNKITAAGDDFEWHIVTLVRDPVARYVSSLFQVVAARMPDLLTTSGRPSVPKILSKIHAYYETYDPTTDAVNTWFEDEIRHMTGVDVFEYPFDRKSGFSVLETEKVRILVLRLESLESCFQEGLSQFIGRPLTVPLVRRNVGQEKWYQREYEEVKKRLRIPRKVCEEIYRTKFCRHFYDDEMRRKFISRWCEK